MAASRDERDVLFRAACAIDAAGEVALEDYARVLGRARTAEALRSEAEPEKIAGVRLIAPGAEITESLVADIEDFARDLASRSGGSGLGWA